MKVGHFLVMQRNGVFVFLCAALLLALTGCQVQSAIHFYDGEALAQEQVAKVVSERKEKSTLDKIFSCHPSSIHIVTVDGKEPEEFVDGLYVVLEAYVLPGSHDLGIRFNGPGGSTSGAIPALIVGIAEEAKYGKFGTELHFEAEAGHEYMIRFQEQTKPWKGIVAVDYWIEDVNTGEVVMGQKPPEVEEKTG